MSRNRKYPHPTVVVFSTDKSIKDSLEQERKKRGLRHTSTIINETLSKRYNLQISIKEN